MDYQSDVYDAKKKFLTEFWKFVFYRQAIFSKTSKCLY